MKHQPKMTTAEKRAARSQRKVDAENPQALAVTQRTAEQRTRDQRVQMGLPLARNY